MANTTNDTKICHEYLLNYLQNIKKQLRQCQLELIKQSQSCAIASLLLDEIDKCLKDYVHNQRNSISKRNNDQLVKFKQHIHESDLCKTISTYQLTMNLVRRYNIIESRSIESLFFSHFRMNI
jgi:hypothetical protein